MDDETFQELDEILAKAEDYSKVVRDGYGVHEAGSTLAYKCWADIVMARHCLRALKAMNV